MEKEAQVHMLPTNGRDIAMLSKRIKDNVLQSANGTEGVANSNPMWQPQHLYFTTDEEIKKGGWVYWTDPEGLTSDINQVVSVDEEMIFISHPEHSETEAFPHECKKIIATTDPKLTVRFEGHEYGTAREINAEVYLLQPSHSFIEEYCKAGGIDKVLVEYEEWTTMYRGMANYKLKTDSNNCIIIHPVEEKMYSRKEMEDAFHAGSLLDIPFEQWIKENL